MGSNFKIVGVEQKSGVYESIQYNNVKCHCTAPFENGKGSGFKVKEFKVKYSVLSEIVGKQLTEKELAALVGKEVSFYYDEFKNVSYIQGLI